MLPQVCAGKRTDGQGCEARATKDRASDGKYYCWCHHPNKLRFPGRRISQATACGLLRALANLYSISAPFHHETDTAWKACKEQVPAAIAKAKNNQTIVAKD